MSFWQMYLLKMKMRDVGDVSEDNELLTADRSRDVGAGLGVLNVMRLEELQIFDKVLL